jgi:hypothetical protein
MNILVIDQCSKSKSHSETTPVFGLDDIAAQSREELLAQQGVPAQPARKLYAGRQQRYINNAVDALRSTGHTVDRHFISAGFGVVDEATELPPYSITFADMGDEDIEQRAQELGLSEAVSGLVTNQAYDVIFFALGRDYMLGLEMEEILDAISGESTTVLFNQEAIAGRFEHVVSIPARTEQARDQGAIVVGLKGVYLQNFADHLGRGASVTEADDIQEYCMQEVTSQTEFDQYG